MKLFYAIFWLALGFPVLADEPLLRWVTPPSFDSKLPGLGLEPLTGFEQMTVYEPLVSNADPADGGNGKYESFRHGTYNHHQQIVLSDDFIIIYWTNHVRDENGPGQRILAKVGRFADNGNRIDWCADEEIVELAPPAMPAARRPAADTGDVVKGAFIDGTFSLVGDRLFLRGRLLLCDGWTDSMEYHHAPNRAPVPDEHYQVSKNPPFRFDIYWFLMSFVQEWKLDKGKLVPVSPVYRLSEPLPAEMQITPTIRKKMGKLNPPYDQALPIADAPADFVAAMNGPATTFGRIPKYAPGTEKIAADGKNGLAHHAEFIRPDGKYVVVRDNLLASDTYYAAVKDSADDVYPPAVKTNLFGTAMPVAGELADGTVWFIGSDATRFNCYITWSKDGKVFDRTKLLMHLEYQATPGVSKPKAGGAQYFKAIVNGDNIWIIYSVAKEKIGLIKLPAKLLN